MGTEMDIELAQDKSVVARLEELERRLAALEARPSRASGGVSADQLKGLIGRRMTFFCVNYIYTGKLKAVDEYSACLSNAYIVYETGVFDAPNWKEAMAFPEDGGEWFVQLAAVESYGIMKPKSVRDKDEDESASETSSKKKKKA